MDRSIWLSLMALGLSIGVLLTGRALLDSVDYLRGVTLGAEIAALDGAPSDEDLMTRTTEAAGCIYGNQPRVRTCWYAWAHPERPEYLALIAERVQADSGGSVIGYFLGALPFWVLAIFAGWKSTRPVPEFRPSLMAPRVESRPPQGRMVP